MALTEEKVTLAVIEALRQAGWTIVSFDFPQSGTGRAVIADPVSSASAKRRDRIVPDVIAVRDGTCLVLENKSLFVASDVGKLAEMRDSGRYDQSLARLLNGFNVSLVLYGIGLPIDAASLVVAHVVPQLDLLLGVEDSLLVVEVAARRSEVRVI